MKSILTVKSLLYLRFNSAGYILALTLLSSYAGLGQLSLEVDSYRESHPNAHSIQLAHEKVISIEEVGGELRIIEEYFEEDLYLDENATYASKASLTSSSFLKLLDIEAYTLVPENGKYHKYIVEEFMEKDELNESFHDDLKSVNFVYPSLNPGGKTILKYSREVKNPRFLNPFYFGNTYPIAKSKLTVIADKSVALQFRKFNMDNIPVNYSTTEKRGKVVHTWETKNIYEYEFEDRSPAFQSVLPHLIPIVVSYHSEGNEVKVLGSVDDLYNWYFSLIRDVINDEADGALQELVAKLIKGKENNLDKVRAIYYWAQEHIKYIDFEAGLGGFIPRNANEVFKKKYGDCKDNSSLLYKMLELAGLKSHITWIGTRRIPYSYEEVPTPLVDDHMILSYVDEGTTYFMDATGRYNPLEIPSSFIQGKEAMISLDNAGYRLEKVPVVPAEYNSLRESNHIELENDLIVGSSLTEVSGYKKMDYFYALEEELSETDIKNWYQARLQKGNNTFLVKSLSETNKYEYDKDLKVQYEFELSNYVKIIGDEIYLNLNLNKNLLAYKTALDRVSPVENDYKEAFTFTTVFAIPQGYKVEYLPNNIEVHNNLIQSKISYEQKDQLIQYEHQITVEALLFEEEEQAEINTLIKKMEKAYNEVIVLKRI